MSLDKIVIRGARQHNLKNIDLEIPRDKFVVITGVSGSGKSSLAFDTIYAEGQRRYVESLSAYARQFLAQMDKPDVDSIEGLSPAVSIDQKSATRNPRSTVATVTEIYDHLRLLFARIGKPHCPSCGRPIAAQSVEQIVDRVEEMPEGTRIMVLGPVIRGRKGEYRQIFDDIRKQGFARVRVDGAVRELSDPTLDHLERYKQHDIDIVVDRLVVRPGIRQRVADSLETALRVGQGAASVAVIHDQQETAPPAGTKGKGPSATLPSTPLRAGRASLPRTFAAKAASDEISFSEKFACLPCGKSFDALEPRMFSFNSPYGACPECAGLGTKNELDEELVIPDKNLSLAEGAVLPWRHEGSRYYSALLRAVCEEYGIDMYRPVKDLSKRMLDLLLHGTEEMVRVRFRGRGGRLRVYDTYFRGVLHYLNREYQESETDYMREEMEKYMRLKPCPACKGARLKPESLAVTIKELNIAQVTAMSVEESARFFDTLDLSEREQMISHLVLKEIKTRLSFLLNVGLSYLTLDRPAATLAGGEGQRIRLATQIGSGLMGVLYILDEPSIGLHQRDNRRLLDTLERLRDLGNTILVVEHDEATIRTADHIIDIGPGAGERGGHVVATGTVEDLANCPESITGQYLIGRKKIETPERRRGRSGRHLIIKGARHHNLKNIDVKIPLGVFVCVTGVSGSGKSSLIDETLYRRLAHKLHGARTTWGTHDGILGVQEIDKVINIDQSPIGRTPRSNPATYTGAFDPIRYLFAQTPEARMRGYKPGRFSFNVKGGRCEACRGDGIIKIEMVFLPDVYVPCETCKGNRYNRETLEVRYKGKNIADVLNMTVAEAVEYFRNIPAIARKLQTIHDVGLDYIKLGQPATTLSGGEAQRVKLATELSRRSTGRTLYLLDEPTTGLHFDDMKKLLDVLNRLVDAGNTVVVIEHNLDVIKTADHLIDLGPEGGEAGGWVVATGAPEEVAMVEGSYTGQFLRKILPNLQGARTRRARRQPAAVAL